MTRVVVLPPVHGAENLRPDGLMPGGWWHEADEPGRIVCDLCPRECHLKPGDRGFCFVRQNVDGEMMLTTYGRSTGFCIDPIEKKPLNHFLPGTSVLSFGTAGCNLGCKFCQNWDISKSREVERLSELATPQMIAEAARRLGCASVAYTYNDPIIWAEYAIDCAKACRAAGVKSVAVSAGYIAPEARPTFFHEMDAANIDLKAFTEEFYYKITYSHLEPVLDTLRWLKHESDVWFEITNLVIPDANDGMDEIGRMCDWILDAVGDEIPLHFSAFHPDFRMMDRPPTPHATLLAARDVARRKGVKYVYVGNVNDLENQSTYCPACGTLLIERNWYELGQYRMNGDQCGSCGQKIAGCFADRPGTWGRKRMPVRISDYAVRSGTPVGTDRTASPLSISLGGSTNVGGPSITGNSTNKGDAIVSGRTTEMRTEPNVAELDQFSAEQQAAMHRAACALMASQISGRAAAIPDETLAGAANQVVMGAFVTAKRHGRLRGCCGTLGQPMTIAQALAHSARRTATEDARMPPISTTELTSLDIDVTLLANFQPIRARGEARRKAVEIGRHGLQIRRGDSAGLLLPVVAVEHELDAEGFLRMVCQKAGLPTTAWMDDDAQLVTFEGHSFGGPFDRDWVSDRDLTRGPLLRPDELAALRDHCQANVAALIEGATPNYYVFGCSDGTVNGVVLSIYDTEDVGGDRATHLSQVSMRPGMPMQASLFTLCQSAAGLLRSQGIGRREFGRYRIEIAVLTDPAMNGTVAAPDLRGVDPRERALLVTDNNRSCWILAPDKSIEDVLADAVEGAKALNRETASVLSCRAESTRGMFTITNVPRPVKGGDVRSPGVAGSFYPADPDELNRLVDDLLGDDSPRREAWPAVMVPHAGLIYSGRIAADVLKRVEIPDTVIVIGPKHTRFGCEWAVAPHVRWSIPGAELEADPELARRLVERIPGLTLDAAAHQREHAIEVELPLLARLAPHAKVVGIALGGGNLDRCIRFASGLADVIREMNPRPLLVVSSDMNHFARDDENRRLDEIALQALERLDPAHLLDTVTQNAISMCGVIPATIVLETLRQLDSLTRTARVGYATSADVSGDTSRVVGYAGMLIG